MASTGNMELDILFSDHHLAKSTLEEFGQFLDSLNTISDRGEIRFWAFLKYISENHPDLLSSNVPDEIVSEVDALLDQSGTPTIILKPGRIPATSDNLETSRPKSRWWQFWKK